MRGENKGATDFIKRMNFMLNSEYEGKIMLIAEDSTDFPNVCKSTLDGGLGYDYKWDLGWMNDTLKYLAKDPIYRQWHHNNITFSMAYFYSENSFCRFLMMKLYMEKQPSSIRCGEVMKTSLLRLVNCIPICLDIQVKTELHG